MILRFRRPVAMLALCVGCSTEDVPVAREGQSGPSCASTSDCALPDEYCAKRYCDSPQGQCLLRPIVCDDELQIVCGCDSVIYWNDCLRQRDGVASSTPGECIPPVASCDDTDAGGCPVDDAFCGRLLLRGLHQCQPRGRGVCWVLPDTCPLDAGGPRWTSCPPSPTQGCVDLCSAIQSQQPFTRAGPGCR
jgi:hypothetical protein